MQEAGEHGRDRGEPADRHTFVLADLAGYTALTEAHGDERAADVAAEFCREVRSLLGDYDADEVKSIGDALLLHLEDPAKAVHLAARIAGEFGGRHEALGVRVGVHTGTAVERDGDWFGGAVNLAARVAGAARPGEVLLTGAAAEAGASDELELVPRGRQRFRNVSEPVEVFALTPASSGERGGLPVDPVCRMALDPARVHHSVVERGVEYHFCSDQCAAAFSANPGRYARAVSRRDDLLVSDRAREHAVGRLSRAYRHGRLSSEELEERTSRAWRARTRADLAAVTRDVPGRRSSGGWLYRLFRWVTRPVRLRLRRGGRAR